LSTNEEIFQNLNIQAGTVVSDPARLQASIEAYQKRLTTIGDVHYWAGYGSDVVINALLFAAAAPAATRGLTGVARIAAQGADYVGALEGAGMALRPVAWTLRGTQRIAEGFAWGLESLNNAEHVPGFIKNKFAIRTWNMLQREAVASLVMGGMSGLTEVYRYE